jgi:hypothetical protein
VGRAQRGERRRCTPGTGLVLLAVLLAATAAAPAAGAASYPVAISVEAINGTGRSVTPGRACEDGGAGAYWHYEYGGVVPAGRFGAQPAEALVHLDLHSNLQRFPNVDGPYDPGSDPRAFLQGVESHASLLNERGSVKVRLASGTCGAPTLSFDGSDAGGAGTWEVVSGTGSYREIAGSGTFSLEAEVNPGADNRLALDLDGELVIDEPSLQVEVVQTYWGSLGTDYLSRRVSVVYRITNQGPGDSYGASITGLTNPTPGVSPLTGTPIPLGDLAAGESRQLTVRHQLGLLEPCALVILGCRFQTQFTVDLPDALDAPHLHTATVPARAPDLPPPL